MGINNNYKKAIINAISNGAGLDELYNTTVRFKADGLTQAGAYCALKEVKTGFISQDETKEDLILRLMDFVVGWCQVRYNIWDDVLKT